MSENSSSKSFVTLQLKLSKELYEKLEIQLRLLQENSIQGLERVDSVEDLIMFYLDHFSAGEEKMKRIEDRMQSVLDTLRERGVDILDLFNSFNQKIQEEEKEKDMEVNKSSKDIHLEKKKS